MIGLAGAVSCTASSLLTERLPDIVILIAAVCVILYSALSVIRRALKVSSGPSAEASQPRSRFTTRRSHTLACIGLGLFAGMIAGAIGVGGGFIIVPISIAYFGYNFARASGTSLLAIAFIALPGIITHALLGHIYYLEGLALMLGSIPGANLGARLIAKIPERTARLAFGGLLVLSALMLVVNQVFWAQ
jgi:uncharacterized membrane protein YfcA